MSIAAWTQWISVSRPRDGHARFGQRCMTSPSGFTISVPQSGHLAGMRKRRRSLRVRQHRPDDLRDHVARALHDHRVALTDVLAVDVVLVVKRRVRDRHAADLHRLELGPGIERARPTDADVDLPERRLRRHRRPLVRPRPAWTAMQRAEPALLVERVHLDHDPVDLVVELRAPRLPLGGTPSRPPRSSRGAPSTGSCGSRAPSATGEHPTGSRTRRLRRGRRRRSRSRADGQP